MFKISLGCEFALKHHSNCLTNRNRASVLTNHSTLVVGGDLIIRHDAKLFLKDVEIGFAEMNSERIRGIFNIQECNPILVVPPNAIIYPKKSMI